MWNERPNAKLLCGTGIFQGQPPSSLICGRISSRNTGPQYWQSNGNHMHESVVHVVPSWSWFSIANDTRVDLRFPITKFNRRFPLCKFTDVYMSSLSSSQWWLHPKDELPATSYFDFQDLQLTLQTQGILTYIIWKHTRSSAPEIFKAPHRKLAF